MPLALLQVKLMCWENFNLASIVTTRYLTEVLHFIV